MVRLALAVTMVGLAVAGVPPRAACLEGLEGPDSSAVAEFARLEVVQAFLRERSEADDNGDGWLSPSEVLLVRSRNKGDVALGRKVLQLLRTAYTRAPIEERRDYRPQDGVPIKLFIMSGQSNMAGLGLSSELPESVRKGCERVLMFRGGRWQPLRPWHFTFGPEIAFGHTIAAAWPGETIGIVKQAQGATGILAWHPQWTAEKADLTGDGEKGNLWKALTRRIAAARAAARCEVTGFVWQQGGKDMITLESGKQYLHNLCVLTGALRRETGVPDLPLVLGSYRLPGIPDDLSDFDPSAHHEGVPGRPGAPYVVKAQFDAQKAATPAKMVPLRGLSTHRHNVHYDTRGQLTLGRLLAEGYLELVEGR